MYDGVPIPSNATHVETRKFGPYKKISVVTTSTGNKINPL
jgi:hypothetical protein